MQILRTKGLLRISIKGLPIWRRKLYRIFALTFVILFGCPFWISGIDTQSQSSQSVDKETKKKDALTKKSEVLTRVLKFGTSSERKAGLVEIEKLPEEYQNPLKSLISESLKKEKESNMRIAFLRTVGNLKIQESYGDVAEAIGNTNEDVVKQAISTIKKLNHPNSWENVYARLKTEDFTKNSNLTIAMIEALGDMEGGDEAEVYLESKLKEKFNSPELRSQIALYLGKKKKISAETTLQKIAFDDKEPLTLRTYCINSLGKIGSKSSIPKLQELMEEMRNNPSTGDSRKNQMLKIYSLAAMVELGAENSFQEIFEFTRDDDSFVRFRAIQLLADTKKDEAKEILEYKSQRDPSPKIQKYAKERLEKWGKEDKEFKTEIDQSEEKDKSNIEEVGKK